MRMVVPAIPRKGGAAISAGRYPPSDNLDGRAGPGAVVADGAEEQDMRQPGLCRWAVLGLLLPLPVAADTSSVWRANYAEAIAEAERLQRPLLIHFYGDHCPPCKRMEREVLSTRETLDLLGNYFVAVKINAGDAGNEDGSRLVQRFGIHSLPSDVILDPFTGRVLLRSERFQDQRAYSSLARGALRNFEQSLKTHLARSAKPAEDVPADEATPTVQLGEPQPMVGLDGYSPVALSSRKEWIRGKAAFAWEHKGITYYMASRAELEAFRESPEAFAPKLLGCDPVILWETDRAVPGDTRYGAFYDGDLYLFQSAETRRRFKANPTRYTRIQHVLRVEAIERTKVR
uniref:DUF255 domain-containing protein n=1 Tax=Schlesneria paludicola TaxID=360056 RepID=A0A7C4QXW4_9PLAN